ncbi:methylated-DNA--[protein]-cysteine S-methyltransferase [Desulfothermus okinawensis JCM 13304]
MKKTETLFFPPLKIELITEKNLILKIVLSKINYHPNLTPSIESDIGKGALDFFTKYFIQKKHPKNLPPLNWDIVTPFQKRVYITLFKNTRFGQSISYQKLAQLIDLKKGQRAVGGALNKNPWPIIIPCHRVLKKNNQIGGFSSGIKIKQILLSHEQIGFIK